MGRQRTDWFEKHFKGVFYSILWGSALLYIALNPQYRTGIVNDDAVFVLGARSLIHPSASPSLVMRPDYPLPGLPVLLAPLAKVVAPHWTLLEWASVIATILSVFLLGIWVRKLPQRGEALAMMALFAFNPLVAQFSGILMPGSFYTVAVIGSFLLMGNILVDPSRTKAMLLGLVLGWGSLVRPEGVLLLVVITATLAFTRRGRECLHVMIVPILFWLFFFVYWWRMHQSAKTEYGGDVAALWSFWSHHLLTGIGFAGHLLQLFLIQGLGALKLMDSPFLSGILILSCLGIIVVGFRSFWKAQTYPRPVYFGIALFSGVYFIAHVFWHVPQPRYALPLLPFLLIFLVRGVHELLASLKWSRLGSGAALGLVLLSYAYQNGNAAYETHWTPDPMKSPPWRSLAWLNKNTENDIRVLSNIAPNIELYTNRPSLSGMSASNPETFLYGLAQKGLSFIVDRQQPYLSPGVIGTENPNDLWEQTRLRLSRHPERFPVVFDDPREKTKIFRIVPEPGFTEAYDILKVAYQHYVAGKYDEAFHLVHQCIGIYPKLGLATNLLGALHWRRHEFQQAEAAFLKTAEILPHSTKPWLNLATLYHELGQLEPSSEAIERARAISMNNGTLERFHQRTQELYRLWGQKQGSIFLDQP